MSKVVISDASCFILLEKIGALDLLPQTFQTIITTPLIVTEFKFVSPVWLTIKSPTSLSTIENLELKLDPGEASAIALALEIPNDLIILDDLKARRAAKELGLHVNGTVGVILRAKEKGSINLVRPHIERIQQTNFRLSQSIVDEVLYLAGEHDPFLRDTD